MSRKSKERSEVEQAISKGTSVPEIYPREIIMNAFIEIGKLVKSKSSEIFDNVYEKMGSLRRGKRIHTIHQKVEYPPSIYRQK